MKRTIFMGTPEFAVPSLQALLDAGHDLVAAYTRADQPAGRGRRLEASPVKQLALAHGLELLQPSTLRGAEPAAELARLEPDLIVVAAYGLLLPQPVLDLPRHGCVNVHGSLLPRHRGAAPIAAAILAGDAIAGVSIMQMDAGVDTGPVLSQSSLAIEPDDTCGVLTTKLAGIGARLLVETLPAWLRGELEPQPQDDALASYAPRIDARLGAIDWHSPGETIARMLRAYNPWPSAFTTWNSTRLKLLRARLEPGIAGGPPGRVVGRGKEAGVVTASGILWLEEVQLAGRYALPIADFLRGAAGFVGSDLASALAQTT